MLKQDDSSKKKKIINLELNMKGLDLYNIYDREKAVFNCIMSPNFDAA